jgi:hypothetical protein
MPERAMKILFLDIDGVLNTPAYLHGGKTPVTGMTAQAIDPALVARVNQILAATGARVVISSTWRRYLMAEQLIWMLVSRGFEGLIVGGTPHLPRAERGAEIDAWLRANPGVTQFCILDDRGDMHPHMSNLVQTNEELGVTDDDVFVAIALLGG